MNSIVIELTLKSAPESRLLNDGDLQIAKAICTQYWEKNDNTFSQDILVTAWRGVDEFLDLKAGDRILIDGTMQLRTIDKKAYKTKLVELNCNNFQLLGISSPRTTMPSVNKTPVAPVAAIAPPVSSEDPDYDDIPF